MPVARLGAGDEADRRAADAYGFTSATVPGGCFRGLRRTGLDAGSGRVRLGEGGSPGADMSVFSMVLGLEFISDDGIPKADDDGLACNAWCMEALCTGLLTVGSDTGMAASGEVGGIFSSCVCCRCRFCRRSASRLATVLSVREKPERVLPGDICERSRLMRSIDLPVP